MLPGLSPIVSLVHSGSVLYRAGTFNFTVPEYNVLTIDLWGSGASGVGVTPGSAFFLGNNGAASSIGSLSLIANGGNRATSTSTSAAGGAGGTASGGDLNDTGSAGGAGSGASGVGSGGAAGGAAAGGGGMAARPAGPPPSAPGTAGNDYGGGGSSANNSNGNNWSGGGGGAGRCRITYTRGSAGAPTPGSIITGTVAVGGAVGSGTNPGGKGADGAAIFSWL